MEITIFIPAFLLVTKLQAAPYKIGTEAIGDRSMFATYTGHSRIPEALLLAVLILYLRGWPCLS